MTTLIVVAALAITALGALLYRMGGIQLVAVIAAFGGAFGAIIFSLVLVALAAGWIT
jgi:hypothetical protein